MARMKLARRLRLLDRYPALHFRPASMDAAYYLANALPEPPALVGERYVTVWLTDVGERDRETFVQLSIDDADRLAGRLAKIVELAHVKAAGNA